VTANWRTVIAITPAGAFRTLGPVSNDKSVDQLRADAEAAGLIVYGVAAHSTASQFRIETGHANQAAARPAGSED
jgi:hypothetical protein